MILTIPYKALAKCGIEELAAQQVWNQRAQRSTSGVLFAQKVEHAQKDQARAAIVQLLNSEDHPGCISVLSMPGMSWAFEAALLKQREPNWRNQLTLANVQFTCVENDRFVYYSATTKMPGNKHCTMRTLPRPEYAERALGNGIIDRYAFANVDDLMREPPGMFDVAWLDYTGPLNKERRTLIGEFFRTSVRSTLIVTALKARWNRETSDSISRAGGHSAWLQRVVRGQVLHDIEYQDGASPMIQLAIKKDHQ